MKPSKKLLLTFDYELFLGSKSGSVQNCLIKPTNSLLSILESHQIKNAIFFVDTTYLVKLNDQPHLACKNDFLEIKNQLCLLVEKGHYVFPHIHPHWLDAVYKEDTNEWSLTNYSKYRFHHATSEEKIDLFSNSFKILNEVFDHYDSIFSEIGYRAGGWSIQPFSDFKLLFEKHNIGHEFSVIKNFKNLSEAQYFDFTYCPTKEFYAFDDDPCTENKQGNFCEYTISTMPISKYIYWLSKIWNKYLYKTGQINFGDGKSVVSNNTAITHSNKNDLDSNKNEMISIELLSEIKLNNYKRFLSNNHYMQFISHPKMISKHHLKVFDRFLKYASESFTLETDFKTFKI